MASHPTYARAWTQIKGPFVPTFVPSQGGTPGRHPLTGERDTTCRRAHLTPGVRGHKLFPVGQRDQHSPAPLRGRTEVIMSKVIVTAKRPTDAAIARQVKSAFSALSALEPSAARIRRAATTVGALRQHTSIRGIVAVLSVEGNGTLPVGKGTIERMGYVADAIAGEWPDVGDNADAILMALYRIAQTGNAADVARAAEMGRKATDGESAYLAIDAVRTELNAGQHKSLTAKPERQPAGEVSDGGKPTTDADADAEEVTEESGQSLSGNAADLASIGIPALIAELHRRYSGKRATVHSDDADGIAALAARIEDLVTSGKVAGLKR